MKRLLLIILLTLICSIGYSQSIEIDNTVLYDIDNNIIQKHNVKYYQQISNFEFGLGGVYMYINDDYYTSFNGASVGIRYSKNNHSFESNIDYLINYQLIYNASYRFQLFKFNSVELSSALSPIGTSLTSDLNLTSFSNGITTNFYAIDDRLTVIGGYYIQRIETLNSDLYRDIYLFRTVYQFNNDIGIDFNNKFMRMDGQTSLFFSPIKFDKHLIGTYYPIILFNNNVVIKPKVSYGLQNINDDYNSIIEAELSMRGWITDRFGFSGNAIYSNSYNNWGEYSYGYLNFKIIYRFI